ncbi:uncharacterized protein LOC119584329 isoform X2 [Penaeus monodon]|uniref:uncharacterized protein LOC119584329 isoform X2 n=1 Tax=Penaeus monodon TaxID=6687 RepID=UPI0018A7DF85|nr:uncharacterized protein LOC119584329 isoform X2 [Penaeus monodon]
MIKALTLMAAVATASALPPRYFIDVSCQEAENVTLCEADLQVCKDVFSADKVGELRRHIYKSCLDENGLDHLDDVDPEILFTPTDSEALSLFGSEETQQAVRNCVLQKLVLPDDAVDTEPFLEKLTFALNDTRPDILERLLDTAESCSIENIDEWKTCVLLGCVQEESTTPVPTTIAPEE